MELQEYKRMFDLEDHHWWFQGRLALTLRTLARHLPGPGVSGASRVRLLDMGCGTGLFLQRLPAEVDAVGLDFSGEALAFTRLRGLSRLVCGDSQRLPFADGSFDMVTAFDLVEHVDRDRDLVAEVHRTLRPGGVFLSTVPAHPFLWSRHDVALHHRRRYRKREFDALFDPALWNTRRSTFTFAGIFPAAAAVRLSRRSEAGGANGSHGPDGSASADTRPTHPMLNRAMIAYHRLEAAVLDRMNAPFGLSIMSVREKRGG